MFERQRIKFKFFQFVRDPTRTSLIFEMYELASRVSGASQAVRAVEARALTDPNFRELYEHRVSFESPPLEVLSVMAADTLGFAYSAHLRKYHLQTDFYREPHGNRVIDYLSYRLYQTHDLWHVVLGYDISPAGELGVQAFTLAQLGTPFSFLLMAGGMLSIVESAPELCEETFGIMTDGFSRGSKSNFLLGFSFEEHWDSSLSSVRKLTELTCHSTGPAREAAQAGEFNR